MEKRSLYDLATFDATLARIDTLSPTTEAVWGSMSIGQMLAHCAEVQEVANGKPLEGSPWYVRLFKGAIRKSVVGPKPYPRSSPTHPQYVETQSREFEAQRDRLIAALRAMVDAGPERAGEAVHALFGRLTAEEKGWAMYKHLDHHLTQFGV